MAMTYELWDTRSGNLLEHFDSEGEALAAVRSYLLANGPEMIRDLALGAVPSTGLVGAPSLPPILEGKALLARIRPATPKRAPSPIRVVRGGDGGLLNAGPVPGSRVARQAAYKVVSVAGKVLAGSIRTAEKGRAAAASKLAPKTGQPGSKSKSADPTKAKKASSPKKPQPRR